MEALRLRRETLFLSIAICLAGGLSLDIAAAETFRSRNFVVTADNAAIAEQVGQKAEEYRKTLAIFWLGKPLPNWSSPCNLKVREGAIGAGGQTTFQFVRGEVLNWNMFVQGSMERILDSVLPHEINHTIFACHFRRPLPRWADEGAATLFEHKSEQLKQLALLNDVIGSDRERFSLRQLLIMKEYPEGMRPMLILYAQGFALADFLVQQRGRQGYLKFLSDGEKLGWEQAIRTNYDHAGIESLEKNWRGWVLAGMPHLTLPKEQLQLAATLTDEHSAARPPERPLPSEPSFDGQAPAAVPSLMPADTTIRSQSQDTWSGGLKQQPRNDSPVISQVPVRSSRTGSEFLQTSDATAATRRFSIQAPLPDRDRVRGIDQDSRTAAVPFTGQIDQHRIPVQHRIPTAVGTDTRGSQFGPRAFWSGDLEPTGMVSPSGPSDRSRDSPPAVSDFPDVPLPSERNVISGSLPQWAGFPGQKKLF